MRNRGTPIRHVDLTGFAERYAKDPSAVPALAREQNVSKPTIYKAMREAGIEIRPLGTSKIKRTPHPGVATVFSTADDEYLRLHYETTMPAGLISAHLGCHHSVLKARARKLGLRRPTERESPHYSSPGPRITTAEAPPVPVRLANVIHWIRATGVPVNRAIKPGLWVIGKCVEERTPAQVVAWANDKRTRMKPEALPLFKCNFDGLKQ